MKKQRLILGVAAILTAASCMTSFAESGRWIREKDTNRWMYQLENGEYAKSCVQNSNGNWFWIDENGYVVENSKGTKVTINGIEFTLSDDAGRVSIRGLDQQGNVHQLKEVIPSGESATYMKGQYNDVSIRAKNDEEKAWLYYDENGELCQDEVKEINGYKYYFDADGEIKWKLSDGVVDGYYVYHTNDASIAINRWIEVSKDQWSYFGSDGKMVTGKQTIDGEEYDFGNDGYISNDKLNFPEIVSIEVDTSCKKAEVGDTVKIPFKIWVRKTTSNDENNNASPSNASPANAGRASSIEEADYTIFKNAYAVSHAYRVNVGDYSTKVVAGKSHLKRAVETKYEIDWDEQVIRIPIEYEGAVFGCTNASMKIGNVKSKDHFGIVCTYPEDTSTDEKIDSIMSYDKAEDAANALKAFKEELIEALQKAKEILDQIIDLEDRYKEELDVEASSKIDEAAKDTLEISTLNADGLAFAAEEGKNVTFTVSKSTESLPTKFQTGHNVASLDFTVKVDGSKQTELDVPIVITISKPKTIKGQNFKLYHIHDGKTEEVPYEYDAEKNEVKLVADKFSTFFFAEATGSGGSSGSDGGSGSGGGSSVKTNQTAANETQGAWKQNEKGWWFELKDGSYVTNSWKQLTYNGITQWYHFGTDGYMNTGWFKDTDGRWYYLKTVSDGTKGMMMTGWQFIDGAWYYLNEVSDGYKGAMYSNCKTPDGYFVGADGKWIP